MSIGSYLSSAGSSNSYRRDIDGLRAVAVLLVIFFHAGFGLAPGGFVGVDVFFVISGYLITGIIVRELEAGHFTFASFYARQVKRIFPALFVVLTFSAVIAFFVLIPDDLRLFGHSVKSTVFFYSNWFFYNRVNYFDGPAIEKPLLHTWSLAVEEQYYLLWPLALMGLYRCGWLKALPYAIAALFCLSLAASQIALQSDPAQAFYMLPYRGWELLLGALLSVAPSRPLSQRAAGALGLAGFAAIGLAAFGFGVKTPFPGLSALVPCLGAAMLIAAGQQERSLSHALLAALPLRFIGKISYSLYLIHWPIFSFAYLALNGEPPAGVRIAIVIVSVALAYLSYRYIETPARRSNLRLYSLARAAVAAAVVLGLWGGLYAGSNGFPWRAPKSVQAALAAKFPGYGEWDVSDCRDDPKPGLVHRPCPIGAAARGMQYDFVLWGDSHARHFASAFSDQAKSRNLSGLVIWEIRCPPLLNLPEGVPMVAGCEDANKQAMRWIASQTKLKMVFLGGNWNIYFTPRELGAARQDSTGARAVRPKTILQSRIEETLSQLRAQGTPAALVEAIPSVRVNVPNCAARARMFGQLDERCFSFSRQSGGQGVELASSILREVGRSFGVPVVETVSALCVGDACRAERNNVILYADDNHVNSAGAHYMGTRLNIPWPAVQGQQVQAP